LNKATTTSSFQAQGREFDFVGRMEEMPADAGLSPFGPVADLLCQLTDELGAAGL
jgi:hypothetical protein